jgi:UDP-2-acetamido-3-amino-2,3-dideoxy-glucuronate N-acetyltransferase
MSRFGKRLELPLTGDGEYTCPFTDERYVLADGRVTLAE